ERGGANLTIGQLRVLVDVAAPLHHARQHLLGAPRDLGGQRIGVSLLRDRLDGAERERGQRHYCAVNDGAGSDGETSHDSWARVGMVCLPHATVPAGNGPVEWRGSVGQVTRNG